MATDANGERIDGSKKKERSPQAEAGATRILAASISFKCQLKLIYTMCDTVLMLHKCL